MTRYVFLDARFVIWLAIDLFLLLVNVWFWTNNDHIWLLQARWMIFYFIFGQFSVAGKLILNGGARQASCLTFNFVANAPVCVCICLGLFFAFRSLCTCTKWHLTLGVTTGICADQAMTTWFGWLLWLAARSSVGVMSGALVVRRGVELSNW